MLCCDLTTAPKKPISDLVSRLRHAPPCYLSRRTGFRHPRPSLWDTKEYAARRPHSHDSFTDKFRLAWGEASTAAEDFVSQLSLSEKIGIVSGSYLSPGLACVGSIGAIERLNFTGLCFSDGPAGYGRSDGVSVFPSGITTAATWDKSLMCLRGVALGEEFRAKGAHVHLG